MYIPQSAAFIPGQKLDATTRMLLEYKKQGTLADYVSKHKNDPNLVALASFVNNLDDRAQAMQHAAPQPKIVDQEIAKMAPQPAQQALPEETGIGQLPAQNIQGMAGGGIIAFDEGGEIPHFDGTAGSYVQSRSGIRYRDMSTSEGSGQPLLSPVQLTPEEYELQMAKLHPGDPAYTPEAIAARQAARDAAKYKNFPAQTSAEANRLIAANTAAGITAAPKAAPFEDLRRTDNPASPNAVRGTPVTGGIPQVAPAAAAPVASAATAAQPGVDKLLPGMPSVESFANQLTGINKFLPTKEALPAKEAFMKEREAASAPVWEKFQSTIDKEKTRLNEGKEQDFYMALIEGGLAAAGATGPNGIQNIAQGFSQGAKSYASALKDFRKAAQENSKMELDMERARAAEKRGDMDAFQRAEDSVKNRNADIDKLKTQGIFSLQHAHTSGQYQLKAAATSAAGHVAASQLPGAQERLLATLGGGDVAKGLKLYQEAQTDKTGVAMMQVYSTAAANAAKLGEPMPDPITFAQNMQLYMAAMQGGGFQAKPGEAPVRTLPGTK